MPKLDNNQLNVTYQLYLNKNYHNNNVMKTLSCNI